MQAIRLIIRRLAAIAIDAAVLFLVLASLGGLVLWITGLRPESGVQVYTVLLVNFSAPTWAYFIIGDGCGQTIGKSLLGVQVVGLRPATAVLRAAVKLLAWELTHVGMFALATQPGHPGAAGWMVVAAAYAVLITSLIVASLTGGGGSLHDLVAGSHVEGVRSLGT